MPPSYTKQDLSIYYFFLYTIFCHCICHFVSFSFLFTYTNLYIFLFHFLYLNFFFLLHFILHIQHTSTCIYIKLNFKKRRRKMRVFIPLIYVRCVLCCIYIVVYSIFLFFILDRLRSAVLIIFLQSGC